MITLKEALINKNNIKNVKAGMSFIVWSFDDDSQYINKHPHWIEMTMFNTSNKSCGKVYIFNEKNIIKDVSYFKDYRTLIYVTYLSEDELIEKLENIKLPIAFDYSVAFSKLSFINETFSPYQFKRWIK